MDSRGASEDVFGLDSDSEKEFIDSDLHPGDDSSTTGRNSQKYVQIVSKDGHAFFLEKELAMASSALRVLLSGGGKWQETQGRIPTINLDSIRAPILEKVIQYFHYKSRYAYADPSESIPEFKIEMEYVFELMQAAHFLDT